MHDPNTTVQNGNWYETVRQVDGVEVTFRHSFSGYSGEALIRGTLVASFSGWPTLSFATVDHAGGYKVSSYRTDREAWNRYMAIVRREVRRLQRKDAVA